MEKLPKELLGLSGEYAVASELCKRGIYAQLTLGHHKRTDILVETEYRMLRIQVKAKQGREWPAIGGIHREDDILVLVDFQKKEDNESPDFYILNLEDWKQLLFEEKERFKDVKIDPNQLTITYLDGWKGLNIKPTQVNTCKDRWDKIKSKVDSND
jgi:hypothetical protein